MTSQKKSGTFQVYKDSVAYGISSIITKSIATLLVPVYTVVFSPAEYGVTVIILAIIGAVTIFAGLGAEASVAIYYYETEDPERRRQVIFHYLCVQILTTVLLSLIPIVFSNALARQFMASEANGIYLRIAGVTFVFSTFTSICFNIFRFTRRPWTLAIFNVSMALTQIVTVVAFVKFLHWGLWGNYVALLGVNVIFFFVSLVLLRRWMRPQKISWPLVDAMVRLGIPYVLTGGALFLMNSSNRFFLEKFFTLNEVGTYGVATMVASGLGIFTGAFQTALGPYMLSIQKLEGARQVYSRILTSFLAGGAFLALGLALFSREILWVFTGPAFHGAKAVVPFLAFYTIFVSLGYIASIGTWLAKKTKNLAWSTGLGAVTNLGLNFLLIPRFGMIGAAVALLISQVIYVTALFWASQRCYFIPYRWSDTARIGGITALLLAVSQWLPTEPLGIAVGFKFLVLVAYCGLIAVSGIVDLPGLLKRLRDATKQVSAS